MSNRCNRPCTSYMLCILYTDNETTYRSEMTFSGHSRSSFIRPSALYQRPER